MIRLYFLFRRQIEKYETYGGYQYVKFKDNTFPHNFNNKTI